MYFVTAKKSISIPRYFLSPNNSKITIKLLMHLIHIIWNRQSKVSLYSYKSILKHFILSKLPIDF